MRIIHISGSPGSGKTALGRRFSDAKVIDTDTLINDSVEQQLARLRDINEHLKAKTLWQQTMRNSLAHAVLSCEQEVLIFVGILNHWSPDGETLELPFEAEKYFIDLAPDCLLRQFYGRYGKEMTEDAEFWYQVSKGYCDIPSSCDYLCMSQAEREWHLAFGYVPMSPSDIEKAIAQKH